MRECTSSSPTISRPASIRSGGAPAWMSQSTSVCVIAAEVYSAAMRARHSSRTRSLAAFVTSSALRAGEDARARRIADRAGWAAHRLHFGVTGLAAIRRDDREWQRRVLGARVLDRRRRIAHHALRTLRL